MPITSTLWRNSMRNSVRSNNPVPVLLQLKMRRTERSWRRPSRKPKRGRFRACTPRDWASMTVRTPKPDGCMDLAPPPHRKPLQPRKKRCPLSKRRWRKRRTSTRISNNRWTSGSHHKCAPEEKYKHELAAQRRLFESHMVSVEEQVAAERVEHKKMMVWLVERMRGPPPSPPPPPHDG